MSPSASESPLTILDGPLGTELSARGVSIDSPSWSAEAIRMAPETIAQIHRDYVAAGATIHTANTFRTRRRAVGRPWREMTDRAVQIAKQSVPKTHRVAGSIAPIHDCYRPDLSPRDPRSEHREMATQLVDSGCDLLICETFPSPREARIATEEAVRTGLETWVALTAGPNTDLMTPPQMAQAALQMVEAGAAAVLVNCTPASQSARFLQAIANTGIAVPIGVYANAGSLQERIGWEPLTEAGIAQYQQYARTWVEIGATLIGGCCGTGPRHIQALTEL
ncbi:homocysteine S-methyltransferase family protein [Novipirellula artificiosorum]|uniref:Homocysteine S-methyltransferase n=1 Tax=Novipirellula artificiosorum TaxID=2528016 RepID=A0A5C6DHM5_9BACT|nr:homocysteine S-methyltransferase family protein [Novipirellula artificiosorum]TWU34459.1 Homocysteine S-methyltransferase [Novipirellula artificiosorum]